jgi:hypothetical protein
VRLLRTTSQAPEDAYIFAIALGGMPFIVAAYTIVFDQRKLKKGMSGFNRSCFHVRPKPRMILAPWLDCMPKRSHMINVLDQNDDIGED